MITLFACQTALAAGSGNVVRIKVTGITELKGSLRATLDAGAAAFTNSKPPALVNEVVIDAQEMELVFTNVPTGDYAVKIFQDENDDRELNTNVLGIPAEKYGISNNARGRFGLPDYKDAKFSIVPGQELALTIDLKKHSLF
jgi:uncharacterized protein (DUF2141 family)